MGSFNANDNYYHLYPVPCSPPLTIFTCGLLHDRPVGAATLHFMLEPNAQIRGVVEFRAGEGPMVLIPEGPCLIVLAEDSAVIHWEDGSATLNAAIPRVDYDEHVEAGRIVGPAAVPGAS